ncbi:MAG: hypothetical protein HW388_1566 [Dehalococcoidia bacterium]|nr:hypothetical protein [Dehalococcoidia bacterium]
MVAAEGLGYLGIGFKSVFKITDRPEIYSGGYAFKFDRDEWPDPANTPWYVLPIPIDAPSKEIGTNDTTLVIPFKDDDAYDKLIPEVERISTELYLFLRWMRRIEVVDEVHGHRWLLENKGEDSDGVTTLARDSVPQRFKVFRLKCPVTDDWVKRDRLTQEYRPNVLEREVTVAFALDDEGRIALQPATAMYGGVYSFHPLEETQSGAKFPIQADFLVQPGREEINYEAPWNHWLLGKVADLCMKVAIPAFKSHPVWRYQILDVFKFTQSPGEAYKRLFQPRLHAPLETFLAQDSCVPIADGSWALPAQAVALDETEDAVEALQNMGVLSSPEIAPAMANRPDVKRAHPNVIAPGMERVNRLGLLGNKSFLMAKAVSPEGARWFRRLYLWLNGHPVETRSRRGNYYRETYHSYDIVLDADGQLAGGGGVWLIDSSGADQFLSDIVDALKKSRRILNPGILEGATEEERRNLRSFLTGSTGVQILDLKRATKEELLPKILTSSPQPASADLLRMTRYCQNILGDDIGRDIEFWVLTKHDTVLRAKEVVFSAEFVPTPEWETHKQFVPGLNFLSPLYLQGSTDAQEIHDWLRFCTAGGVKANPDNGVEIFAENFARQRLSMTFSALLYPVDKLSLGYDLEGSLKSGSKVCIEVKGLTDDRDVELSPNETRSAYTHRNNYYLCVVSGIPNNPTPHLVPDPVVAGKKEKITVPVGTWKSYRLP